MILSKTEAINRAEQGDVKAMEALVQYFMSKGDLYHAREWEAKMFACAQRIQNKGQRPRKKKWLLPVIVIGIAFILVYGVFGQLDSAHAYSGSAQNHSSAQSSSTYDWSSESDSHEYYTVSGRGSDDPFEGIYYNQSRDAVLSLLGEPDSICRPTSQTGNTDVYDTYYHVNFLGYSGTLQVYYSGYFEYRELKVKAAKFYITANTEEEHNNVRMIEDDFYCFYTTKYGEPYYCVDDQSWWSRGNIYTSEVNETIRLSVDSVSNLNQPITLWLVH